MNSDKVLEVIKLRRKDAGLKQSEMLPYSQSTYSRIESGKMVFTVTDLYQISHILKTDPITILQDAKIL